LAEGRRHTPGAKTPFFESGRETQGDPRRPKAEALGYLEANATARTTTMECNERATARTTANAMAGTTVYWLDLEMTWFFWLG
jgi:hypothetical protein